MYYSILVALASTYISILLLNSFAVKLGLVDRPCSRKLHKGEIPVVGGMSIFFGVVIALVTCSELNQAITLFIISAAIIVFIGVLDDKYDLSVRSRLIGQFLVGSIMIFGLGDYITQLGDLFLFGEIQIESFGIFFTFIAILAAINAYNMIDGIDGLLGALATVSFFGIAVIGFDKNHFASNLSIIFIAALLPFILANLGVFPFRKLKIFMGDAGSMLIGLAIIWALVYSTQSTSLGEPIFRPIFALYVVAIPLMDMVAIMFRRLSKGQSPFKPDRDHIHHIFMRAGFTSKQALAFIAFSGLLILSIGIYGELTKMRELYLLMIISCLYLVYIFVIKHAWKVTKFSNYLLKRSK
ncbi:MAG: UDP-N-acetylglucosamine--undecaprenyl-phosphate N-acetylglucosaminephosphotransferase [Pseudoalteromonas sp.]|uniref:UDP-N-acetylglucosamine--undecaprenyl-phosphate N-acetylglucosaminephosphotransferase n=1 Tax=Pseudoalteromonas sp. TaxID=53249 RepID=UPI003F96BB74